MRQISNDAWHVHTTPLFTVLPCTIRVRGTATSWEPTCTVSSFTVIPNSIYHIYGSVEITPSVGRLWIHATGYSVAASRVISRSNVMPMLDMTNYIVYTALSEVLPQDFSFICPPHSLYICTAFSSSLPFTTEIRRHIVGTPPRATVRCVPSCL